MREGDVLMCHDKLLPLGLNQQCKHPLGLGQKPLVILFCDYNRLIIKILLLRVVIRGT